MFPCRNNMPVAVVLNDVDCRKVNVFHKNALPLSHRVSRKAKGRVQCTSCKMLCFGKSVKQCHQLCWREEEPFAALHVQTPTGWLSHKEENKIFTFFSITSSILYFSGTYKHYFRKIPRAFQLRCQIIFLKQTSTPLQEKAIKIFIFFLHEKARNSQKIYTRIPPRMQPPGNRDFNGTFEIWNKRTHSRKKKSLLR